MGDRFYKSQLDAIGICPGYNNTRRKKKMAWTDERKQEAIKLYQEQNPTEENTIECVRAVADILGESVNGVRTILSKAGVYIKKTTGKATSEAKASSGTRVLKETALASLREAIESLGKEVDNTIVDKLTGKAAAYFTSILTSVE